MGKAAGTGTGKMLGSDERLKLGFRDRRDGLGPEGQEGDGWRRHGGFSRVWLSVR